MTSGPSSSSSTKPSKFDLVRLLSEIQSDPNPSASQQNDIHPPPASDDEDDFMSDKYLATNESKQPLTYTDKRRKLEAHRSRKERPKSLKQREEELREEGLARDLLAEAEIVAGGGRLQPESKDGSRRWDLLEKQEGVGEMFREDLGQASADEDGTAKAMRMMLAMGYRRGEALGKRMRDGNRQDEVEEMEEEEEEESAKKRESTAGANLTSPPDDTDPSSLDTDEEQAAQQERAASQAREEDEYLTGGESSSLLTASLAYSPTSSPRIPEPLRPDQRWLGLNRRAGIGMIPRTSTDVSAAIRSKASSYLQQRQQQAEAEWDYRTRISREHQERHNQQLLSRARKTLIELDRSSSDTHYSPLWLNADLYHVLSGHKGHAMDEGTIDEKMQRDPAFKEAVELLQAAFGSEDVEQVKEAKTFCELGTKEQLELVLERLKEKYRYCLFCGCRYKDADDIAANCPGEEEEDHN